jgi:hypothetical protein
MGWDRFAATMLAAGAVAAATGARAMTAAASGNFKCTVVGGEKLPAEAGDSDALCTAIRAAVAKEAPNAQVAVEVRVLTPSMLAAMLVVDGKGLPEQKFAVMDRNLNPRSMERFAQSIASKVAQAAAS